MNQIRDRKHEAMGHYTYAYACGLMGLLINYVNIYNYHVLSFCLQSKPVSNNVEY